jgi:hypothetical protein
LSFLFVGQAPRLPAGKAASPTPDWQKRLPYKQNAVVA